MIDKSMKIITLIIGFILGISNYAEAQRDSSYFNVRKYIIRSRDSISGDSVNGDSVFYLSPTFAKKPTDPRRPSAFIWNQKEKIFHEIKEEMIKLNLKERLHEESSNRLFIYFDESGNIFYGEFDLWNNTMKQISQYELYQFMKKILAMKLDMKNFNTNYPGQKKFDYGTIVISFILLNKEKP